MAPDSWGSTGLRTLMVSHKEDFVRTLTGKLLAYAIGRGLDHHDMAAIRRITRDAARGGLLLVIDRLRHCQEHAVPHGRCHWGENWDQRGG